MQEGAGEADSPAAGRSWERRLRRGELTAVADVRAGLRALLGSWGAPGRADTAVLLASELVTNALVHTDGGAVVTARLTGGAAAPVTGRLRVEVRDFLSRPPTLRPSPVASDRDDGAAPAGRPEAAATSGRGLLLVHTLADCWGVRAHGVGKAVWFELDAQEP
ncbi:ATP-binding protein [Streptomyces sp. SCA3-4]|uniref:ATP-binding protein n=1 Tax=Streptomyces sichuanensis TaxID=2871810 RepID=UPI001CE35D1C|nr:ATP-binding protein [Streptomyces sichuanensis]MCA6090652.1 ATP-binding protein [Streptomyces sichuanensis]